ncbi:MAG: peptidylprolyl isomerase [Elusimicrobia bacterium]|nr:peptidylprolyl isomerase [Elusimicrobiota bacterium]
MDPRRARLTRIIRYFFVAAAAILAACPRAEAAKLAPGLYASLKTSKGAIICRLFDDKTPAAVRNFGQLAQGVTSWVDPESGKRVKKKFYDGLSFYKVVPGGFVETGDPLNDGTGGPGFTFPDEILPDLKFDRPGRLALANDGKPGANGSRFFITVKALPEFDGKYTIFGQVVGGQNAVDRISKVKADEKKKPIKSVILESVEIFRVEEPASPKPKTK